MSLRASDESAALRKEVKRLGPALLHRLSVLCILGAECSKDDSRSALHYFQTLGQQVLIAAVELDVFGWLCFQIQCIANDESNGLCFPEQDIAGYKAAALYLYNICKASSRIRTETVSSASMSGMRRIWPDRTFPALARSCLNTRSGIPDCRQTQSAWSALQRVKIRKKIIG